MKFTNLTIYPAENGFMVTGSSWDSQYTYVFTSWTALCEWVREKAEIEAGPRGGELRAMNQTMASQSVTGSGIGSVPTTPYVS